MTLAEEARSVPEGPAELGLSLRERRGQALLGTITAAHFSHHVTNSLLNPLLPLIRALDGDGLAAELLANANALGPLDLLRRRVVPLVQEVGDAWAKGAIAYGHMAQQTRLALIDGAVGVVVAPRGRLVRALRFTIANGRIAGFEIIGDPGRLAELDIAAID